MKKIFIYLLVTSIALSAFAQSPQKMSYQAVIRNSSNQLVTNHVVGMRISILQGSTTGTPVYVETQTPTTNANGLASIEIGGGLAITGTFSNIDWSTGTYFVKTETDPTGGTIYTINGTSQLLSVPYALYAKTSGTSTEDILQFLSQKGSIVVDVDGNIYSSVRIGSQVWMAENLKTTKYNDKTDIPLVTDFTAWSNLTSPAYCWNNNDIANKATYGALYNWYTVNSNKLCPAGWHVPSDGEWKTLEMYLGMTQAQADVATAWRGTDQGTQLKSTTGWNREGNGTNTSGFTTLPGGFRSYNGNFDLIGDQGCWWSSSEDNIVVDNAWRRDMYYLLNTVYRGITIKKIGMSVRCLQGEGQVLPTNTTLAASLIGITTATSGGNVKCDGGAVTARGVCWSTSVNPTVANSITTVGIGTETFTSLITGLIPGTTYYVRAYATNNVGTCYGTQISFTTQNYGTVIDIDGNIYKTITIGTKTWMAGNLKTTKYNDGTTIPLVTDYTAWSNLTTPGYCWYSNDEATFKDTYGALYNCYTVITGNLCPTGWHVSANGEWETLTGFLSNNGYGYGGSGTDIAKSIASTSGWIIPQPIPYRDGEGAVGIDQANNNSSGFNGSPGGSRDNNGSFNDIGIFGQWRSANSINYSWIWYIKNDNSTVITGNDSRNGGYSVRCVKN